MANIITGRAACTKTVRATVKGLKKGTYFVHIRTVNGKAVSNWSGAKKVRVK